jgi:hypothetical protein
MIVAGGRDFNDFNYLEKVLIEIGDLYEDIIIVSGNARGADKLAIEFAQKHDAMVEIYPADWSLGKSAGYIRNQQMADISNVLVAFWDGTSKGTKHMIATMQWAGKPTHIFKY